ncbi:MAG: hypothetical protein V4482_01110 [Pseudomonadota bacterium]
MKKTLFYVTISALTATNAFCGVSLESKIKAIDEKIRKEEQEQSHNAKKLQELVSEYNKLVQENASIEQKEDISANIDQTPEEAIAHRLKEHERRLDELEKTVAALLDAKNPQNQAKPQDPSSIIPTTTAAVTSVSAGTPTKHAVDTLATEQAEAGPAPSLDTKSPSLAQFNQAMALLNAGLKNDSKEDLKNAAEAFELITKTYPDETYANKAFVHGGDAHYKLGNVDEAQKSYKMAITKPLDVQNAIRARLGYGETLLAKNNKEDACAQVKILAKETLDDEQKKRFSALKSGASCGVSDNKSE